MPTDNLLEMEKIDKSFAGVHALKGVDFSLKKGEVHALMGENGAGKSTLIKILTGVYKKDSGTIWFDNKEFNPKNALEAQQNGISPIYQELSLIPDLSVSENIFLGRMPRNKFNAINWPQVHEQAAGVLNDLHIDIDVTLPISRFGTAIQQITAIVRAITLQCKLIVMDEPTSSLDKKEVEMLYSIINGLKAKGIAVIFITHRIDEIFRICSRATVLKDGELVGTYDTDKITKLELIKKMVGKNFNEKERYFNNYRFADEKKYFVEFNNLKRDPKVQDISVSIKKGEIVGFAGLLGSGRTESAKIMFGYDKAENGTIKINGDYIEVKSPKSAVRHRFAMCPENRREEGIIPNMSVKENITLAALPMYGKFGFVSDKKKKEVSNYYINALSIKTANENQKIRNLSGGNQQKVLLARWLATDPQLIILDEPTRGIDVGAKAEIENLIMKISNEGISVIFISSELAELVRNCDRIIVFREGRVVGELTENDISEEKIMDCIAKSGM
ncbi:MAG: sugar ABC transporter ATP-binding protein [Flexilinea sp.]